MFLSLPRRHDRTQRRAEGRGRGLRGITSSHVEELSDHSGIGCGRKEDEGERRTGGAEQHAPAALAHHPEGERDPEEVQELWLDCEERQARAGRKPTSLPGKKEERRQAEKEERADLAGPDADDRRPAREEPWE